MPAACLTHVDARHRAGLSVLCHWQVECDAPGDIIVRVRAFTVGPTGVAFQIAFLQVTRRGPVYKPCSDGAKTVKMPSPPCTHPSRPLRNTLARQAASLWLGIASRADTPLEHEARSHSGAEPTQASLASTARVATTAHAVRRWQALRSASRRCWGRAPGR